MIHTPHLLINDKFCYIFVIARFTDESLRWVIANGQFDKAKDIIKNACKWNNKNYREVMEAIGWLHLDENLLKMTDYDNRKSPKLEPFSADNHQHVDYDNHKHTDSDNHQHTDSDNHQHTDDDNHQHTDSDNHQHTDSDNHQHTDSDSHKHTDSDNHQHTDDDNHQSDHNLNAGNLTEISRLHVRDNTERSDDNPVVVYEIDDNTMKVQKYTIFDIFKYKRILIVSMIMWYAW